MARTCRHFHAISSDLEDGPGWGLWDREGPLGTPDVGTKVCEVIRDLDSKEHSQEDGAHKQRENLEFANM